MNVFARKTWILSFSGRSLQPLADVRALAGSRRMGSQTGAQVHAQGQQPSPPANCHSPRVQAQHIRFSDFFQGSLIPASHCW